MTNLEWLKKMKKEDEQYLELSVGDGNKEGWQLESQYRMKFRKMKALEIIAEELIDINRLLRIYIINTGFKINDIQ